MFSRLKRPWLWIAALLAVHAGLLGYGAVVHSPAIDEVGHFPAGLGVWHQGRFDLYCVNPPLVRTVATLPVYLAADLDIPWTDTGLHPVRRPEFAIGRKLIETNAPRVFWWFTIARWMCIPFSLLAGVVIFRWARELYGTAGGFIALVLWCFDPMVLGNAQMITPDTGAAAFGVFATYLIWKWLRPHAVADAARVGTAEGLTPAASAPPLDEGARLRMAHEPTRAASATVYDMAHVPTRAASATDQTGRDSRTTWSGAFLAGLVLGLAELCKTSWIILFPLWPVLWLVCRWTALRLQTWQRRLVEAGQLAFIPALALYVLNLGYAFDGTLTRLGDFEFASAALKGDTEEFFGNRFKETWLGDIPVPLPKYYVVGIDIQKRDFESGFLSYLRGEWRREGWWYWYLYGLAVKMPAGTLLLLAATLVLTLNPWAKRICQKNNTGWRDELILLAPAITLLVMVSSQTGFNHHLRYVLPCFPFLFIWCGKLGRVFSPRPLGERGRG